MSGLNPLVFHFPSVTGNFAIYGVGLLRRFMSDRPTDTDFPPRAFRLV